MYFTVSGRPGSDCGAERAETPLILTPRGHPSPEIPWVSAGPAAQVEQFSEKSLHNQCWPEEFNVSGGRWSVFCCKNARLALQDRHISRPFRELNYDSPRALRSPVCKTARSTCLPFQEFNKIGSGNTNSPACRHSLELACIGHDR